LIWALNAVKIESTDLALENKDCGRAHRGVERWGGKKQRGEKGLRKRGKERWGEKRRERREGIRKGKVGREMGGDGLGIEGKGRMEERRRVQSRGGEGEEEEKGG